MNQQLNPLMQSALAPFMPHNTLALLSGQPPKSGPEASAWREADLMRSLEVEKKSCESLRKQLLSFYAPDCPADQYEMQYKHPDLGMLTCHFAPDEYDGDDPRFHKISFEMAAVYLHNRDISLYLPEDDLAAMEMQAAKSFEKERYAA